MSQPVAEVQARHSAAPAVRPWASLLLLILFIGWMIVKQRMVLGVTGPAPGPYMTLASIGSLLILVPWALLLHGRWQVVGLAALNAFLTLLLYADVLYFQQFGDMVSSATFRFASQLGTVSGSVLQLMSWKDLRFWVDIPLLLLVALLPSPLISRFVRWRPRTLTVLALSGGALVWVLATVDPLVGLKFFGHAKLASRLGPVSYHLFDTGDYIGRLSLRMAPSTEATTTVQNWFAERRTKAPASPLFGVAEGRNVIILQIESLQAFALGLKVDGQEVTPNLNRLARESMTFTDFYSQTGQGVTSDADLLANCSLHPTATGAVYYDYAANDFYCLPSLLRNHGYKAIASQGMPPDFWNLKAVYPRIGFEQYYSLRDLVRDEWLGIGLSDESFLRQSAERLQGLPEPFYSFLVTLSSHGPFAFEGMPHELQLGALEGTVAGHYLHAVHYTDRAIGHFVQRMKESGLLDRSVLLIYGDHAGVFRKDSGLADLLHIAPDNTMAWVQTEKRIPFLLRLPQGAHAGEYRQTAGQADIAPTLVALLGLRADDAFFMGRDMIAEPEGSVAFYDGGATDQRLLVLDNDNCYDRTLGYGTAKERCVLLAALARKRLALSRQIVERNLISALRSHL